MVYAIKKKVVFDRYEITIFLKENESVLRKEAMCVWVYKFIKNVHIS